MSWLFRLDFQQGSGWEDVTTYVDYDTFTGKTSTLWNELKPVADICNFHLRPTAAIARSFIDYNDPVLVNIQKDGSDYFTGYVRKNVKILITINLERILIECIDRFYLLQKKILTTFMWENYKVCDYNNKSTSIVHQLIVLAGLTLTDTADIVIDKTIDYFVVEENLKEVPSTERIPRDFASDMILKYSENNILVGVGAKTYLSILTAILFQFGYTFYFDESGIFIPYNFLPVDTSNSNYFLNTTVTQNILQPMEIIPRKIDYEGVDIRWYGVTSLPGSPASVPVVVYRDVTGQLADRECYILLDHGEHYPEGADTNNVYVEFELENTGVIAVKDVTLSIEKEDDIVVNTFTYSGRKALLDIENTSLSVSRAITRLEISGTVIMKGQDRIKKCRLVSGTERVIEYKAENIRDSDDAAKIASGLSRNFIYGNIKYSFKSKEEFDTGEFCTIDEDLILNINKICVIIQKKFDEVNGEHRYVCESIVDYVLETVSEETIHNMPAPMQPGAVGPAGTLLLGNPGSIAALGFSGTNYDSPSEGDVRTMMQNQVLNIQEWTGGEWSNVNINQLGTLAGGVFLSLLVATGITSPGAAPPTGEPFPSQKHRIFNVETNLEDQNGVDDWVFKIDVAYSAISKFGFTSLFATPGNFSNIQSALDYGVIGADQSLGFWLRINGTNSFNIASFTDGGDNYISFVASYSGGEFYARANILKGGTVTSFTSTNILAVDTYHFVSVSYDSSIGMTYLTSNNNKYAIASTGTWDPGVFRLQMSGHNTATEICRIDEICFAPNLFVNPDIWIQHYTHDIPWATDYAAPDIVVTPGPTGRVLINGPGDLEVNNTLKVISTTEIGGNTTIDGDVFLSADTTESRRIEVGAGRSGNGNSYIDFIGDATYTDYALRIRRFDTGPNAISQITHRGTGYLNIYAYEAAALRFISSHIQRMIIHTDGKVAVGNVTPTIFFSVNEKTGFTSIGGQVVQLTNRTGAVTIQGQLVIADTGNDDSVILAPIAATDCIGVFLESGTANGAEAWVVVGGIGYVAMDDNLAAVHGNWVGTGVAAGYANNSVTPPAALIHFKELGHCLQSVAAGGVGTHVIARCNLHFN